MITLPGNAVGAGRALTVGENEFGPLPESDPGVIAFSVGDGSADAVGLEDGGESTGGFSFVEHAVKNPMPNSAAALAATAVRRTEVDDVMMEKPPWRPFRAAVMGRSTGPEPTPALRVSQCWLRYRGVASAE